MRYLSIRYKTNAICLAISFVLTSVAIAEETVASDAQTQEILEEISLDELRSDHGTNEERDDEAQFADQPMPETDLEELQRSFALYKAAIDSASYDEADTLAKRMVELAIGLFGLDSHEASKALTNLGLVQQKNKEYESAVLNFTASIEIIERLEDRLSPEIMNPLRGLGAAQLSNGRPDLATQSFDRAVHISHVNEGPHNLSQVRVLEDLAETYLTVGDTKKALSLHQFIYNIEARNADFKSEAIIPALERHSAWLHRMNLFDKERVTLRRIIRILEDTRGKKDLSLVGPLTDLGRSYLYVSDFQTESYSEGSVSSGDTYLKRAIRIVESNPDAPWFIKQQSIVTLGDYYTLSGRATKANRIYKEAWGILSDGDERLQTRADTLEEPRILQKIDPPKYYNSTRTDNGEDKPDNFEVGTIVVEYRVSSRGATRDIEVIRASPSGLDDLEYSLTRAMRRLIHRPRMENGETVDTPSQIYTHEFFYRPSDLTKSEEEETDTEAIASEES